MMNSRDSCSSSRIEEVIVCVSEAFSEEIISIEVNTFHCILAEWSLVRLPSEVFDRDLGEKIADERPKTRTFPVPIISITLARTLRTRNWVNTGNSEYAIGIVFRLSKSSTFSDFQKCYPVVNSSRTLKMYF